MTISQEHLAIACRYAPHHHRDREGHKIDDLAWRRLRTQGDYCILAEYKRATETIQVVWHGEGQSYDFAVRVKGGKAHGIEIHCRSEASAMALFDAIKTARQAGQCHPFLVRVDDDDK